jgi:hypothetical protein
MDIVDATTNVAPLAPLDPATTPGRPQGARGTHAGEFARVFELAEARRRRLTGPDTIPEEVWDDISRAGQLADDLHAEGHAVRFETHHLTGRVVASLCDLDGNVVRPVGLYDVLTGFDPEPAPAA